MVRSGIGDAPKRREDLRFLTGHGRYLDDLTFDRLTHAAVLRSPHAHAEIRGIDTAAAKSLPGVLAVLTAPDARTDGLKPLQPYVEAGFGGFIFRNTSMMTPEAIGLAGELMRLMR